MSIEVNGVTLPDIPSEVLEQYPYAAIVYSDYGGSSYALQAYSTPLYLVDYPDAQLFTYDVLAAVQENSEVPNSYVAEYTGTEWTVWEDNEGIVPIGTVDGYTYTLVWANHDICWAELDDSYVATRTDTIYFARNDSDPNYFAPKSWFDGMAQQVRRLAGTSDKLTTTEMLELAKGVEVGGGLAENERIYQVGTAASTLDGSTLIFESTAS